MFALIIGLAWGLAIGIVLSLWAFVRTLERVQKEIRDRLNKLGVLQLQSTSRVTALESRKGEPSPEILSRIQAQVAADIIADWFAEETPDEDDEDAPPVTRH